MEFWNAAIFVGALLLVVSIVASDISSRLGAPLLLVFIALGMLAGEDGPGGIRFDDYEIAYAIGTLALAVIIFDGGMRTRRETFRVTLRPAFSLATLGVLVTAVLTGVFAARLLGLHWLQGMLIGAIVGSTDAAAVFALLRNAGATLQDRVASTLEVESASNDPMAIFLTVAVLELLLAGKTQFEAGILVAFVQQFGIGAVLGLAGGRMLVWLINRLRLQSALYPLLAAAGGLFVFAAAQQLGGSGYLAIFLAGVVLGNAQLQAGQNVLRVHDGLAWLSQIVMFVILGLLVTPSEFVEIALPALGVAAFLMLVARPAAVFASLLRLEVPPSVEPAQRVTLDMPGHFEHEIVGYELQAGSIAAARELGALELPEGLQLIGVLREGAPQRLDPALKLEPRDYVYFLAQPKEVPLLNRLFDPHRGPDRLEEHRYFGDFVLNGDALLGDVAAVYGIEMPAGQADKTLAQYLDERTHGRVVVGDRAPLGNALLVVREVQGDQVLRVGLKLR